MLSSFTWSDELLVTVDAPDADTAYQHTRNRRDRSTREALARANRGDSRLVFQEVLRRLSLARPLPRPAYFPHSALEDHALSLAHVDGLLPPIDWSRVPHSLQPSGGYLPSHRVERKTRQVLRMVQLAVLLIRECLRRGVRRSLRIVEFCAGSGFVLLPLAALFPEHEFVLIDMKEPSLDIARQRIALSDQGSVRDNVQIRSGLIQEYDEDFDVGIALHACGSASDIALDKCIAARAGFVICPCCIGKVKHFRSTPKSNALKNSMTEFEFQHCVRAADIGHNDDDEPCSSTADDDSESSLLYHQRRQCKFYVEEDRRIDAVEHGYVAYLTAMEKFASPKNHVLVGFHSLDQTANQNSFEEWISFLRKNS